MGRILTLFVLLLVMHNTFAQSAITGKIVDKNGQPVEGASVLLKGTSSGTASTQDGNFTITAKKGDVLVISALNFANTEVKVGGESSYTVTLNPQDNVVNEVVVTALGIKRTRNSLPYAAQQVTGDEVSKTRSSNFVGGLSGKVAGLEIRQNNSLGGSTNVVMRGFKSLLGNNQALFVIDGVPVDNTNTNKMNKANKTDNANQTTGRGGYDYGNAVADINPDDIESLNVLKGAAASALYGSRAANGVVMITTKKGKKGLGITINSGVTISSVDKSTFPKYQNQYGAGYGTYYDSPDGNFFYFDVNGDGQPDLVTPTTEDASWGAKFDPSLMVYQWDAFDVNSPNYHKARPWLAASNNPSTFFVSPASTNNSIAIDGGGDKGWFKLGYTRTDERGVLPNSEIKKDIINFGASYNITNKLTATGGVNYSHISGLGRYGTGYSGDHATNLMTNFREWWETNVDVKELKDAYDRQNKNVTWNWADPSNEKDGLVPIYWNNPYFVRYQNYETDGRSRYFGNVSLNYNVTKWLNILGRVTLDYYNEIQEERVAVGSLEVPYYSRYNHSFSEYNYDLLANFNTDITRDLNFKATTGLNIRRTNNSSIFAETNGGLVVPGVYALSNTKSPMVAPAEAYIDEGVDGIFGSATFGYKDMLFLDLTGRRDKASTLQPGNNVYFYPSASLGFVFSKLIKNTPWLSYGKARVNYAEVGNSAPPQSLLDYYTMNPSFGTQALTANATTKNNQNLVPERTKSYEGGVEMAFFKNRLGFDVTYYHAKSVNQIVAAPVSDATGYDFKYINAGSILNQGFEVSLYGTPVKTHDFTWNININWTRNRNQVLDLNGIDNLQLGSFPGGVSLNAQVGQPYGILRGSDFIYLNGEKVVDGDGYYEITSTQNKNIGDINPDWIAGINNSFKYKDFALSLLIDTRHGGDVFSLDMYYGLDVGLYPETAGLNDKGNPVRSTIAAGGGIINKGVTEDGKPNATRIDISGSTGAYGYELNPDKAFVYDASYVKLRELTLTYSFPQKFMNKIAPFKGIDLSLIGRNLWIIHKNLPYSDPEEGISSGNLQGFQVGAYPTTRSVGINLKLRF